MLMSVEEKKKVKLEAKDKALVATVSHLHSMDGQNQLTHYDWAESKRTN